jgi:hypothetical protein
MKLRSLLILFFVCFSTGLFSQSTIDIFINGVTAGKISLDENQNEGGISLKKSVFTSIENLSIKVYGKSTGGSYHRKVKVIGDDGTQMHIASETAGTTGEFVLTKNNIFQRLQMGKSITLYLEKTPASIKSKERVTSIYLGTVKVE